MATLWIDGLCKKYPAFYLDHVTFEVGEGKIMGFVGRNGAGKTTTIKSLFNYVHPDEGEIYFFGLNFKSNELEIKSRVGYVGSDGGFYAQKRLGKLTEVTRTFYPEWDEAVYRDCLRRFNLDESKRIRELSEGMKVKYQLALALSHHAKLLVLDEPTSGLDPVSRDDLLELFLDLAEKEGVSILFSTHITSDLEKCADFITYIKDGRLLASTDVESFRESYRLVAGDQEQLEGKRPLMIGSKAHAFGFTGLIRAENAPEFAGCRIAPADLESIMIYTEQEDGHEQTAL